MTFRSLRSFGFAYFLLLLMLLPLMPLLSQDFFVTWDEPIHNYYGQLVYEYFRSGFRNIEATSYANAYYYGGMFDLVCVAAQKIFLHSDPFDVRHVINSLFGWFALCCAGAISRRHFGGLAGILTVLFLCFTPRFFADCMNNPKDLPFAAFATLSLIPLLRSRSDFPYFSGASVALFIVAVALAINIRVGGMLFLGYGGLVLATRLVLDRARFSWPRFSQLTVGFLCCCLAAIVLGAAFWPWAHANPLLRPFQALEYMSHFRADMVASAILFAGKYLAINQAPWDYMPRWIGITTPIAILAGAPFAFFRFREPSQRGALSLLTFAVLFPLIYIVVTRPAVYDAARHVLFVIPPLVILSAAGWSCAFERFRRRRLLLAAALMAFLTGWYDPVRFSFVNHPNQIVYFNPLIGGVKGAFLRYDLDYWNNSFKQAIDWLNELALRSEKPLAFSAINGNTDAPRLYSERFPALRFVPRTHPASRRVAYLLVLMRGEPEFLRDVLANKELVHTVLVDGVPICFVRQMNSPEDNAQ